MAANFSPIDPAEFARLARDLLGDPNPALSSKTELRFGSHGSTAVHLLKQTWYDHEANEGGGVLDLVTRGTKLTGAERFEYLKSHGYLNGAPQPSTPKQKQPSAIYDYPDADGALLFQVCRYDDPKTFKQRKPNGNGGYVWSVKGVRRVPYRLQELQERLDNVVMIVEGERDVDSLWERGVPATTNAGGAGKFHDDLVPFFKGADVVIIPDRDPQKRHAQTDEPLFHPDGRPMLAGQDHAQDVAAKLHGVAKRVRVLELWHDWPEMPEKGDVSNWLGHGGTAEKLYALIEKLPDWKPVPTSDEPPAGTHSKNLLSYSEMIRLTPPSWLVTNVLPQGGTAVLFGESNSYKSFIAIDLACCVALGIPWHGNEAKQGNVIYVASEAPYGVATQRIPAWMAYHKIAPEKRGGIFLRPVPPLLDDPQSLAAFRTDIASVQPVPLIVYDVLAGTMKGSEKETDVIAAWVRVIEEIQTKFQCTQLFVTHSPYSDAGRIRGGTHLWGSFGSRLKAAGDSEQRTTILSVDRHKDHDAVGLHWGFKLDVTDIDELPEHTSLVPVMDGDVTAKPKGKKLTGAADEALRSFKYALAEGVGRKPGSASDHIPTNVVVLTVDLWRRYFDKLTASRGTADAKRKRFDRGGERLLELELAAKWGEEWWLTAQGSAVS